MKASSYGIIIALLLGISILQAQETTLAATLTVITEGVALQRVGTDQLFELPADAVMPIADGDRVITASNGRAFVDLTPQTRILLLPNSHFELQTLHTAASDTTDQRPNTIVFAASFEGILIQRSTAPQEFAQYTLTSSALTVVEASADFAVWAVADRLEAVISNQGELTVYQGAADDLPITISQQTGITPPYTQEALALSPDEPLHPARLMAAQVACTGVVNTNGSLGLRVRNGASLDSYIVNVVQDGDTAYIVGISENGEWYRVTYETGFGWHFKRLVTANCDDDLPIFPNLTIENNEFVRNVRDLELDLLQPYYGLPGENEGFYR